MQVSTSGLNERNGARRKTRPVLIAIVGGSGSGKSWLAKKLQSEFGDDATRISLDNFYRDRSSLSLSQRERINFDHPRAIDWPCFRGVLKECLAGRSIVLPQYDFTSHCRTPRGTRLNATPLIIFEGLWLLRRPSLRRLFALRIFIECSTRLRLERRLNRDASVRGRTTRSVRRQFRDTVEPMHTRFVAPQKRWADAILHAPFGSKEIRGLVERLRVLKETGKHGTSMLDVECSQLKACGEFTRFRGKRTECWM